METVQQNGRFTLFSSKFLSIYSILYGKKPITWQYLGRFQTCKVKHDYLE